MFPTDSRDETYSSFAFFFFSCLSSISWLHFLVFSPPPHQPVPTNRESPLREPLLPSLAGADRSRLVEQSVAQGHRGDYAECLSPMRFPEYRLSRMRRRGRTLIPGFLRG